MANKSMAIAIILSLIFSGLGIAYAGNVKKGVGIFLVSVILNLLGIYVSGIFSLISFIVWAAALYMTYTEVRAVNGQ